MFDSHMHGLVLADQERIKSGFIEGLLLPVRSAKMLARDPELRRLALTPVAWLAILCAAVAVLTAGFGGAMVHRFYVVFAALAPLPTLLFGGHYARLAAETRKRLGITPGLVRISVGIEDIEDLVADVENAFAGV